jgi:hypothetical protein
MESLGSGFLVTFTSSQSQYIPAQEAVDPKGRQVFLGSSIAFHYVPLVAAGRNHNPSINIVTDESSTGKTHLPAH